MSEKIAVVTGANSGIGKVTAKVLISDGYRVVMICRNREKAEETRAQITQETGSSRTDIVLCNLGIMEEVKAAAETIRQTEKPMN